MVKSGGGQGNMNDDLHLLNFGTFSATLEWVKLDTSFFSLLYGTRQVLYNGL